MKKDLFATAKRYLTLLSSSDLEQGVTPPPEIVNSRRTGVLGGRNFAFTLAEVLITLGIIGVVAALTMPTLISNTQKRENVTRLKKAYNVLSNLMATIDEDGVHNTTCFSFDNANECFEKLVKKKINHVRTATHEDKDDICSHYSNQTNTTYTFCKSYSDREKIIQGTDGITYFFTCTNFDKPLVDVNGPEKGPNKGGIDLFEFYYSTTGKSVNGKYVSNNDWRLTPTSGTCDSAHISTNCTSKVLQEGKMDYLK